MKNGPSEPAQRRSEKPNPRRSPDQIPHEIRNKEEYDHVVSILRADLEKTPKIASRIKKAKNDIDLVNKLRKCTFPTLGVV